MGKKAYGAVVLIWLVAGLSGVAFAQSPALGQEPQQSSTVVVTAVRPVKSPTADAEARIRKIVARQATAFDKFLSLCQNGPIANPDFKIMCGRRHIQAKDRSLGEGLDAFEKHDYTLARQRFKAAYAKAGYPDAALMLAHMHRHGLGAPKDAGQGIRWLRVVAEDRFNPFLDTMRFNRDKPEATNARIDAAMALARMYQLGDEVAGDWNEVQKWYARAAEFGFIPAWNALGEAYLSAEDGNRNARHAIDCFTKAAQAGYGPAVYNLGNLSHPERNGVLVQADESKSRGSHLESVAPLASAPAADDPADMASDTFSLALPELTRNPADAAAFGNLRRAADALNIAASPAAESEGPVGEVQFVVRVTGLRAVPWKSYGAMRAAVLAYEKYKSLAPDAVFRFAVMPPAGMKLPPNFTLRVRTEQGQEFPIRLEHGELFTLPLLPDLDGAADLVSNFKGGPLRIGLLVHTRTIAPEQLRLGDLRLRYEINAAILMFDEPWEYDAQCKGRGRWSRCKRPSKVIWHRPWTATSGAWIVEGSRRTPLQASDDPKNHMYRMPIGSEHWGNDAIIEFDYKVPQLRPRKLFEAAIYEGND